MKRGGLRQLHHQAALRRLLDGGRDLAVGEVRRALRLVGHRHPGLRLVGIDERQCDHVCVGLAAAIEPRVETDHLSGLEFCDLEHAGDLDLRREGEQRAVGERHAPFVLGLNADLDAAAGVVTHGEPASTVPVSRNCSVAVSCAASGAATAA